jgi:methionyl-tRNA synthetase
VRREIQQNREETTEKMAELNRQLNAFQEEFSDKLFTLGQDLFRQIEEEGDIFRKQWKQNHDRM